MTTSTGLGAGAPKVEPRSNVHPAQRLLPLPGFGVIIGSFLPWVQTSVRSYGGFEGAGRYTFYLGVLLLGAAFLPFRRVAAAQAALAGAGSLVLSGWQVTRLVGRVGFQGWLPGSGLVLVLVSGLVTGYCVFRMLRDLA